LLVYYWTSNERFREFGEIIPSFNEVDTTYSIFTGYLAPSQTCVVELPLLEPVTEGVEEDTLVEDLIEEDVI
jgi:hypothetical protein